MTRLINQYCHLLNQELRKIRRNIGSYSLKRFARVYLSNICNKRFSRMHRLIFANLMLFTKNRRARIAIAAPRGHAKSTIVSLVYVLWCLLNKKEKLILIVSNTEDQAIKFLRDIREQIETNPYINEDFPEICQVKKPKPWSKRQIQLPNGAMVFAYGINQQIRGIKKNKYRPSLIIADDMESLEQAESEEQREKLREWFNRTLLNAGDSMTNVIVVGTILHQDSLLAELTDKQRSPGWASSKYRAVQQFAKDVSRWEKWTNIYRGRIQYNGQSGPEAALNFFNKYKQQMLEETKVLWPEQESYYELMVTCQNLGYRSFQSEKQNEPIDPERCIFKKENFQFWDYEFRDTAHLIESTGKHGRFYAACDPSLGRSKKHDYTAIITLLKNTRSNVYYVIDANISHAGPHEAIEKLAAYASKHNISRLGIETNSFQVLLAEQLKQKLRLCNHTTRIENITNSTNKNARIAGLEPYVNDGSLKFNRNQKLLLDQLYQFPLAKHDDGPDALQMAVYTARKRIRVGGL
ncbi:MAG: phage terminase large subunit [Planctomycetota bacterium]|jgi:predicted phage terminase large subunit-like protein